MSLDEFSDRQCCLCHNNSFDILDYKNVHIEDTNIVYSWKHLPNDIIHQCNWNRGSISSFCKTCYDNIQQLSHLDIQMEKIRRKIIDLVSCFVSHVTKQREQYSINNELPENGFFDSSLHNMKIDPDMLVETELNSNKSGEEIDNFDMQSTDDANYSDEDEAISHVYANSGWHPASDINALDDGHPSSAGKDYFPSKKSKNKTFYNPKNASTFENTSSGNQTKKAHQSNEDISFNLDSSWIKASTKKRKSKVLGPPCVSAGCQQSSKRHCPEFSLLDRQLIFDRFMGLNKIDRRLFVKSLVDVGTRKRVRTLSDDTRCVYSYYLELNQKKLQVCREMFMSTLGMTSSQVNIWLRSDVPTPKIRTPKNVAEVQKSL